MGDSEIWRPLADWPYDVSSVGRVRTQARILTRRNGSPYRVRSAMLRPAISDQGYPHVKLCRPGRQLDAKVHLLVAEAFHGPRPHRSAHCRHLDGDPANNRVENLAWGTATENSLDTVRHGMNLNAVKSHCPRGHVLADPNLTQASKSAQHRACLACSRARAAAHYSMRKYGIEIDLQAVSDEKYRAVLSAQLGIRPK